ncbi:hypothetical protein EMIHUDRAFT_201332 [Emiliania huxleyi CCMP1516]|uniref:Uncharacterized protein n=2 Tax=Emiliania huxleyi TaxID=2903 RepID=A0A0D3KHT2_EMIH1|nr:hypothetical protein EMIHUDRAFT_201332 [Emiliania huxleyi CCMP1516]EOD35317.1 hypothetical protein EMIHUDRAFT_201332 [Emiliania huxleyi CCMP1516]|eukprot:XP_005787746.1 hypothetical protein EMIHUDRAFT_201332 [Emiliania huxleyi CCMP1516]
MQSERVYRFDGSTVLVIKTDLTYTVTLQTFCTLLSGNRRDAAVSQPLLRQPPAEAERVAPSRTAVTVYPTSIVDGKLENCASKVAQICLSRRAELVSPAPLGLG